MARHSPQKIITTTKCFYGCNNKAHFQFKSGRVCCSDAIQKCQGHINAVLKSKRSDVDENGLNALQRGQAASCIVKHSNGSYATAGIAIAKTKNTKLPNGKRRCEVSNEKVHKAKLIVGADGLTGYQRCSRKGADTRINDVDSSGLNQYERWTKERVENGTFDLSFEKALRIKSEPETGIRYQGSYELKFILKLVNEYGVEWVRNNLSRGPSIKYVDFHGKSRWYLSDFIIGNTVYEIKSNWTWNKRGKDLILEQNNINKLEATACAGYEVHLIMEGVRTDYVKKK